jgi:hypothetical protein
MKLPALLSLPFLALASLLPLRAETAAPKTETAYPLTTCVVSGEALDSMDGPYIHTHKEEGKPDREVRLCCKGCLKKFSKDPAKYLGKLDAAAKPDAEKPAAPAADAHAGHAH